GHGAVRRRCHGGGRARRPAAEGARRGSRPRSGLARGMGGDGRSRRQRRRHRGGGRAPRHRRPPLYARGQLLLQCRALHPARRGEDGDVSQGAARLSRGDGAPLSRDRARRGALRRDEPAAYFVKGAGSGRRPTVVLFDGMDNAKEMSVIFAGLDFAKRGINTLAIDGPGQAEALRLRNIHSRHDYEVAGTAAYDYVTSRLEVDPKRVAVMGYSFGGYHAPRVAAFEKRYAAAVPFGAMHWNSYDWVAGNKAKLAADPRTSSTSIFQFRWVVGAPDNETALEWAKKFTLEGVAQRIECAFLVLHGENDRIVPLAEAKKLYERVGSK